MSLHDEAYLIAAEHVAYCRKRCMNIPHIMRMIGREPVRTWDECVEAVAVAWLAIAPMGLNASRRAGIDAGAKTKKAATRGSFKAAGLVRKVKSPNGDATMRT